MWEPADLPVDAAGNTKPGFRCVHPLENGNGPCDGNVFTLDQAIGDHSCVVADDTRRDIGLDDRRADALTDPERAR